MGVIIGELEQVLQPEGGRDDGRRNDARSAGPRPSPASLRIEMMRAIDRDRSRLARLWAD